MVEFRRGPFVRPEDVPFIFISEGPGLRLVVASEFESQGAAAPSVVELSEAQAFSLMNRLAYWFEQQPALGPRPESGTVARDY